MSKKNRSNKRIAQGITVLCTIVLLLVSSCKSVQTSTGEKVKAFSGTIVYDVQVEQKSDTSFEKNKKDLFGTEMYFTVFKNGDLQRRYSGTSPSGYDLYYIDLEKKEVLEKYNNSDSLYVHSAGIQNIQKLADLRSENEEIKVLNYDLDQVSVTAQESPSSASKGRYLSIKYWYADDIKVDKSLYAGINDNMWSYFMNRSDGSIFLKYEIDYFTYKVTYTAKQILPGKYERTKEKMSEEVPRVQD